jgi:hypothetical protein
MRNGMIRAILPFALVLAASDLAHGHNCKCLANKQKYEQGQVACMLGKLARCEMVLNNPSWKILANSCPETRRQTLLASLATIEPRMCTQ